MIASLNQNANLLVALANIILVVVTIFYVVFTRHMVKEMQITREADLRPYLMVDTIAIDLMFYLVIRNIGKTAAQNVRIKLDKSVVKIWKKNVDELPLFTEGITFLPPGKEYVITLGPTYLFLGKDRDETKHPVIFAICVDYQYFDGKHASETTPINLEEYMNTTSRPNEIVKSIEKLNDNIKRHLDSLAQSAEKLSKIEAIASPSGLDLSQGVMYRISEIFNEKTKQKIKINLNLATLSELVCFLEIKPQIGEKILERKEWNRFFSSFDELKDIEGMTDEILEKIKRQTFICNPYL